MTPFQRGNRLYAERSYQQAVEGFLEHTEAFPNEGWSAR